METYTICTRLYLTSFTHHVHETHPCCVSEVCSFLLFSSIPLCEYTRCVHLFSCLWTLGCFVVWAIMNKAAMNILKQVFGGHGFSFILDKELSRSGIAGSKGRCMFHFVRNYWALFQSCCTILHSYQQYTRAPVVPHSHQHLYCEMFKF